jgi:hypothetical protein
MFRRNVVAWMGSSVLLAGGLMAFARGGDVSDSDQVSKLLSETKTMAFQLKDDAATMESFSRMDVSWESHKVAINQIKEHVNALGKQVAKLQAAEASASPWQVTAIDRINPYLDEMGGYTTALIEHLNGDKRHNFAEYKDYLEANADYSADLASMVADFVDYGNARHRVERLGDKLEITPFK